jgi:hypothetical protein
MIFRRHVLGILTPCLLVMGHAIADEPKSPSLAQLMPRRAELTINTPGLQALPVPVEILRACRPGLADLRLLADDQEVPYLLDATGTDPWTLAEKIDVKAGRIRQDARAPLCEPEHWHGAAHCESIELAGPPKGEGWELVFTPSSDHFVERVQLAVRRGDKLEPIGREESIYRLPDGPGERLRLPLPAAAVGAQLTIVMQGDGAALSPKLRLERGTVVRGGDTLVDRLPVAAEWRDRAGTHLVVERPGGFLPSAIELHTTTATFDRKVQVFDLPGGEARNLVGEARVSRISLPAAGGTVSIDAVQVPLGIPRGRRLEIVIDDGDSPKLEALEARAVLPRPVLLFDRQTTGKVDLLFGGGRVEAPRYDLQSLLPSAVRDAEGVRGQIAARLREHTDMAVPALGPFASNPRFDATPILAAVTHAGPVVDAAHYASMRPLVVAPATDGLSRYLLRAADLAAASAGLEDLRVVDAEGRQWPYLLDKNVDPEVIAVDKPVAHTDAGVTRYAIPLPSEPLTVERLELDVAERFFDRAVVIVGKDENGHERRHDAGRLGRRLEEHGPVQVEVNAPRLRSLEIEVTDGGDAPLTIEHVRLIVPTAGVAIVAPAGHYRLLIGNPEAEAPSYELRGLASLVAQLDAVPVEAQALAPNPQYSASARLTSGSGREHVLVWVALSAAVLILGFLTLRMARAEPEPEPTPPEATHAADQPPPEEPRS